MFELWKNIDSYIYFILNINFQVSCDGWLFSFFIYKLCLYRTGPRPHIPFPPDLILYVNLVAKGALKFFKTLAPRLTVLDIPYFADAYSCTVRAVLVSVAYNRNNSHSHLQSADDTFKTIK